MKALNIKQLNLAEKYTLLAVCAALLLVSGRPQIAQAGNISTPMFDQEVPPFASETNAQTPQIIIKKTIVTVATAYSSTPDQTDNSPFTTANGKTVYDGLVAANWLPFGTKIRIPDMYGDKIFTVNDRMNNRYDQGRLDVWMKTRNEAKTFGIRRIRIQIIETENTES